MKPRAFGRRQSQTQTPAEDLDDVLADSGEDVAAALEPAPTAAEEVEKNALTESELDSALNSAAAEVALASSQETSEDTPEASGAADTASSAGQDPATDTATEDADTDKVDPALLTQVQSALLQRVDVSILARLPQSDLSREVGTMADEILNELNLSVDKAGRQSLVTALVSDITGENTASDAAVKGHPKVAEPNLDVDDSGMMSNVTRLKNGPNTLTPIEEAKGRIQTALMDRIDVAAASRLPRKELARQIANVVVEILGELKIQLNLIEQRDLVAMLLNDMLGLGPLEPLLADEAITDIMVNGPNQVYVERKGKLEITDVTFRNNAHLMNIATRIVSRIGRRIDESQPLVDARLEDGSRVNIIAPPLAIDGTSISIRKFAKQEITLDVMAKQNNLSANVSKVLKIAGRCGLNILISGGTGSGKTTLLNAVSRMIEHGERIVTIEDAAELQLQQPHVVRLETRPANLEGSGAIDMRDLVKNALRMRPDRIILGEVRGAEALDMLQAMNTGHDGSMSTIHANNPREALTRLENMVAMVGVNLPSHAVRTQIASAVNMIIQVSRMRDGMRRITHVAEITGMEGDIITTQELFTYEFEGEDTDGKLIGSFRSHGIRPAFLPRAEYFGLGRSLMEAVS